MPRRHGILARSQKLRRALRKLILRPDEPRLGFHRFLAAGARNHWAVAAPRHHIVIGKDVNEWIHFIATLGIKLVLRVHDRRGSKHLDSGIDRFYRSGDQFLNLAVL